MNRRARHVANRNALDILLLGDSIARVLSTSVDLHFLLPPSARALQQAWNEALIKFRAGPSRITCGWKPEHVADTIGLRTQEHYGDGAQSVYASLNTPLLWPQTPAPACANV